METTDCYKTLAKPTKEILFKEKKSKFFGSAYPIVSEDEVKPIIENLRKKHRTANHICFAWQLGVGDAHYRANDDGEPNNSAGMPIYGQIKSYGITNVLVVVARIFGGTKLGVGGLIGAYRTTAQMALEESRIVERTVNVLLEIKFDYHVMDNVMRVIKNNNLEIVSQKLEMECVLNISTPKSQSQKVQNFFNHIHSISIIKKKG
jgi:uncharacterized YigZ family protein